MAQAVSDVLEHLSSLPTFPKVAAKLMLLLDDPDVGSRELSEVISMDPSLVMKVIQSSNSPFYMLSRPVENVEQAVLVLGINTIKTITTAAAVIQGLSKLRPRKDVFDINQFWKHSYGTAVVAARLAHSRMLQNSNRVYLVGLIHDIGKLIIAYYWPETWKQILTRMKAEERSYTDVELELFTCSNTEIAVTLCKKWSFPPYTYGLLQRKLQLDGPASEFEQEYRLLCDAENVVSNCGFSFPAEDQVPKLPSHIDKKVVETSLKKELDSQLESLCLK